MSTAVGHVMGHWPDAGERAFDTRQIAAHRDLSVAHAQSVHSLTQHRADLVGLVHIAMRTR